MSRPKQSVSKAQRIRLTKAFQMRERAKELFKQADELESPVLHELPVGTRITIDGQTYVLRDNFIGPDGKPRNVAFKPASIRHYEFREATKAEMAEAE